MKWMISEDKLGPDQKDVIDELGRVTDRPVWIKGHAGSGKSVLLLHALRDYLARNDKASVAVVVFTNALVDLLETGLQQIPFLAAAHIPVYTIYELKNRVQLGAKYDAVFCDEIQDLPLEFIQSMKSACKALIIAGDAEQSIYNYVPGFGLPPASSQQIAQQIQPVEKNLTIIYRLTNSVLKMLKEVFPAMLADKPNLAKEDTQIRLYEESVSVDAEIEFVWNDAKLTNSLRPTDVSAILLAQHDSIVKFVNRVLAVEGKEPWRRVDDSYGYPHYTRMNRYLEEQGIDLMYVGKGYGSLADADSQNKIIIMTYHSAKGLDFDYVYLPMANDGMYIHSNVNSLLLVALSRSKAGLMISYTGSLYRALGPFLRHVAPIPIPSTQNEGDDGEIVF